MDFSMVRGDTKIIMLDLTDVDGDPYTPQVGDSVTMTVRAFNGVAAIVKTTGDSDVVAQSGGWEITLQPEDTSQLLYSPTIYEYDIEVTLADGYVQTVIPCSRLSLTKEVTYAEPPTP